MPKRQSGFINNNIAVSSKFDEVEYAKIIDVHDNLDNLIGTGTTITYGSGIPDSNTEPARGTNSIYVDIDTDISYICKSTSPVEWIINGGGSSTGGGQFADKGTTIGKSVPYLASTTGENETITVVAGTNGFAIEELTIASGTELIVSSDAVFKVL